ncbi:phenylalanine--tRNA ligase subunit beta [Nisaea acidiphila]|uniref:Phenylalanine--tRNA ligase beta subunit n=1 Tax=Nisaea acidiphila TaxID=1862145 RepID=A0A9J7AVH8_9PROT|nr:phenylalanine--tRNA ligase subunit beta [Nisaea acidiphila]UUX51328.1 phenylalanine--tRNA ligase subunit beta [Nisaea acidiphila]
MKFTLSWLKEHLETEASLEEICDALPMLGLEVEELINPAEKLKPFTIAHVVEAVQHPNADRLRVCKVDTGKEIIQVVCGAPNARTGMKGVFAPSGSHIPGTGVDLKPGVIRGEESNGMLCSEREMGLSEDHDGIIDLPEDAPVGASFADYAGLDDPVIDIAITPDRADCLGVRGIARDLAAAGLGKLKPLDIPEVKGTFESPIKWDVDVPEPSLVPYVVGRYFKGVKNGPSPKWMQDRLTAVGLRPISGLVDITNYMMMDVGRPLHAYDADKVSGGAIRIRLAKEGESYEALNEKTYTFEDGMLVLGDEHGIDDMAGIMGGERTGCTDETVNMYLEVAIFDPISVAMTGRKLNVLSDARYRFERGLDPTGPTWGVHLASKLVQEICGGEMSELVVHGQEEDWKRTITLRHSRIRSLGGIDVPEEKAMRILTDLGFEVSGSGEALSAVVPPWRRDVEGEACLVEEVLRINGYDEIPVVSMETGHVVPEPALSKEQIREGRAKRVLSARGMLEAVTFSFLSRGEAELFGGGAAELTLVNPISSELDVMRPSILPNLLASAARNANMGASDAAMFEVGPQYADATPKGQSKVIAGIRVGRTGPKDWAGSTRAVDVFDAKADVVSLLEALDAPAGNLQVSTDAPAWYHPGRSGALRLGPNVLAWFGELHPKVLKEMDVRGPAVAFEIFLEKVPTPKSKGSAKSFLKLSPFQPLTRDFAFVVEKDIPAEKLVRAAAGADKALISGVRLFDEYQGKGLGESEKSLAIQVTLQPVDATLTDEQIETVGQKIVAQVEKATGGRIRG